MKRLLLLVTLLLALSSKVNAQITTVTATITDAGGQVWSNGTYTFKSSANSYVPLTGVLDANGSFTQIVTHTAATALVGDVWIVSVCPNTTSGCFNSNPILINGATQSLTSTLIPPDINFNVPTTPGPIQ